MRALVWHGKEDVRCDNVPDPKIEHPRDAIIKVTSTCICGSDLHLYGGFMPGMESGDVLGHEPMGEVVEVGSAAKGKLSVGERIVIPFTINCDECYQCKRQHYSVCENTNRNGEVADKMFGHRTAGLFGYTHLTGGYQGGQAEYLRVPFADATHIKVPSHLPDEKVVFLSDILPTGWQAAVQCEIEPHDTVAIWGAGPVGQMTIRSAILLGAKQVISIDQVPERLSMSKAAGAITINFEQESVLERLSDLTDGKGPDKCIDAVGMEAHASVQLEHIYDRVKQAMMLETDRPHVLREMAYVCRAGGTLSIPGVYGGLIDKFPMGQIMNKGLTIRTGQTHVRKWTDDLVRIIEEGKLDPSFVITHQRPLDEGPELYATFREKKDGCIKVVLKP
jgi:threonine dehydrogenase-like Zn-dependent dehydrogenase